MNTIINKMPPNLAPVFERKGAPDDILMSLLVSMIRIREFEKKVAALVEDHKVVTPCHLYIGQEGVAAGVCSALRRDDYIFGTHRSHGHYLAKGGDMKKAMAEIFGRATGCSHGRGGSMHLCAPELGILGTSSIVAGSVPLGIGAALAEAIRKSDRISVIFHGDGVPEEGAWNESANFAAVNKLPVLFVCENNFYCTHLPLEDRRCRNNLTELAEAHGIESVSIDGNNVLEVYHKAEELVGLIREGHGPKFLECRTYRWLGHVGHKDNLEVGLRSREELDAWKERCPIKTFSANLIEKKVLQEKDYKSLVARAVEEVRQALEFALQSPFPSPETLLNNVYSA
jgi:acetoin:2,6-dichlorophenolindophenol oxidoreductase subunit alpha